MERLGAVARVVAIGFSAVVAPLLVHLPQASDAEPATGRIYVVQAVPDATYRVLIDGDVVGGRADVGSVLGPFDLAGGDHEVSFDGGEASVATTVTVRPGSSKDIVVHLPAAVGGEPVVDVYPAPVDPVGPGKARVLLAHTATVPPADVRLDGKTVFENIANGEFVVAEVPAGHHTAAIVPAGGGRPLLGPIDVDLPAGQLTLVYAVGSASDGSMNVIAHQEKLASDGSRPPSRVETGTAGLVADLRVSAFPPP